MFFLEIYNDSYFSSIKEAVASVIPIALIVLILSVTCVPLDAGVLVMFLFGTVLLILGMSFFTVGSGISVIPFLIAGYVISLIISFFVPTLYTGIAFDSGGVASGPMTSTFMLPFAVGACEAIGGNVMTDAFGIVAMIAMAPLITIQVLGFHERRNRIRMLRKLHTEISMVQDDIVFFDMGEDKP